MTKTAEIRREGESLRIEVYEDGHLVAVAYSDAESLELARNVIRDLHPDAEIKEVK